MIRKIISIKNVGNLRDCVPNGDTSHRRLTLIYSENGMGKTTLAAVLRSLKTSDARYLSERKTLGATGEQQVSVLLENSTASFANNAWDRTLSELEIFDSQFVAENVYSGAQVDYDHRRNLYQFAVGEQGVLLARRVDEVDDSIRDVNALLQTKGREIKQYFQNRLEVNKILALQMVENLETRLSELQAAVDASRSKEEILRKAPLCDLSLVEPPWDDLRLTLEATLEHISAEAAQRTREHLTRLAFGPEGEEWIGVGLSHMQENQCPFCGQPVTDNDLVDAYRQLFDATYRDLQSRIAALQSQCGNVLSKGHLDNVVLRCRSNEMMFDFWRQFVPGVCPSLPEQEIEAVFEGVRADVLAILRSKAEAPLQRLPGLDDVLTAYGGINGHLSVYNEIVQQINCRIAEVKEQVRRFNLEQAQREIAMLKDVKLRHDPEVNSACEAYRSLALQKAQLEKEKQEAKERLDLHSATVLGQYQAAINDHLTRFGAGFRVVETDRTYVGGKPSATYRISINNVAVDLGGGEIPAPSPCFRTCLSDGDKNTLAFAFFLSRLDIDSALGTKVVVFDDPITSLDRNRRTCTAQQILRISGTSLQTIVLSHDAYFLRELWRKADRASRKTLHIRRDAAHEVIAEWDVLKETQNEYLKNYDALTDYVDNMIGDPLSVARSIRPLLEGNLRFRFPKSFGENEWLGDFIDKVRTAVGPDPLVALQPLLPEYCDINDYSARYHHANAQNEPIVQVELQAFGRRTLRLVSI